MKASHDARRRSVQRSLTRLLVAAVTAGAIGTAVAAWDGQQEIVLGDSFSSAFGAEPGAEIHEYDFYAPKGTKLKAVMKVEKGADLVPGWKLFDDDGTEVPLGAALAGTKIKNFVFETGGRHHFQITAASGTGRYAVTTAGGFPVKFADKAADGEIEFEAVAGSTMDAALKGATFTGLEGPRGALDLGAAETSKVKRFPLPFDGVYRLTWEGTAKVGVKIRPPAAKRFWFLDMTESTPGLADLQRSEWLTSAHAAKNTEPFRHWDAEGEIPTSCARCHSSTGYQDWVGADGTAQFVVNNPAPIGTVVDCDACHNSATPSLSEVTFPSGSRVTGLGPEARCLQCHQGRESTVSLDATIAAANAADDDTESSALRFRNIHYFAAGASLFGNVAKGAYQYAGKTYANRFPHVSTINDCQECHNQHTLKLRYQKCAECHAGVNDEEDLHDIRQIGSVLDYDGDGDTTEGLYHELETMASKVYDAMRQYAQARGTPIVYDSHAYPYFFNEGTNTGFNHWTPRLLRAAYNYQYWQKDPGTFAHNGKYIIEILYDTLESLDVADSVTVPGFASMHRNDSGHFDNTAEAFRHWDADGEIPSSCARCHSPEGFAFYAEFGIDPVKGYEPGDGFACEQCHVAEGFNNNANPPRRYIAKVTFPSGVSITNDPDNPDDSFLCMTCHQGRASKKTVDDAIAVNNFRFQNIHYLAAGPSLYGKDAGVGYEYSGKTYVGEFPHAGGDTNNCAFCHLTDHTFLPQLRAECTLCHPEAQGDLEKVRRDRPTDYDGDGNNTEKLKDEVASFGNRALAAMNAYALANGKPGVIYDPAAYPYFFKNDGAGNKNGSYTSFDAAMLKASFNIQMWAKEPGAWAHNTKYILALLYDSIEDMQNASANPLGQNYLTTPTVLTRP